MYVHIIYIYCVCVSIYTCTCILYLVHVELAHIRIWITSDRNEVWSQDLYHSTALVKAAKSLAPSNVIRHGKAHVPYQKPGLKSMAHAVHSHSTALAQCAVATQREQGIDVYVCSSSDEFVCPANFTLATFVRTYMYTQTILCTHITWH